MKKPYYFSQSFYTLFFHFVSFFGETPLNINITTKNHYKYILHLIVIVFSSQNLISQNITGGATCEDAKINTSISSFFKVECKLLIIMLSFEK